MLSNIQICNLENYFTLVITDTLSRSPQNNGSRLSKLYVFREWPMSVLSICLMFLSVIVLIQGPNSPDVYENPLEAYAFGFLLLGWSIAA